MNSTVRQRTTRLRAALAAVAVLGSLATLAAGPAGASDSKPAVSPATADTVEASAPHLTRVQRHVIQQATRKLRTTGAAVAAGYLPSDVCVSAPGAGVMGFHYVNPAYVADGVVDPTKPDMLVFVPTAGGHRTLGAVEWFGVDPDQDLSTDGGRPALFDQIPFDGPMPGHEPGMPIHFDLHAWIWVNNPAGELTGFNPALSC